MLAAIRWRLSALHSVLCSPRAKLMETMMVMDVGHSVVIMWLGVCALLALDVEVRPRRARVT